MLPYFFSSFLMLILLFVPRADAMFTTGPLIDLSRGQIENDEIVPWQQEDEQFLPSKDEIVHKKLDIEIPLEDILQKVSVKKMAREYALFLLPSTSLPSVLSVSKRFLKPYVKDHAIQIGSQYVNVGNMIDIADSAIRTGYAVTTIMREYNRAVDTSKFVKETLCTLAKKPVSSFVYKGIMDRIGRGWYSQVLEENHYLQPLFEYLLEKHLKFPFEFPFEFGKKFFARK